MVHAKSTEAIAPIIKQEYAVPTASKVLLIGLDAADWILVSKKIKEGKLPHLAKCMASGASGPLRSLRPFFSPSLWATIATGKRPPQHGITGFTLPDEAGTGLRTYNSALRQAPAFWNILSSCGKWSNIIGWWTTAPAEAIRGVMVDETFKIAHAPINQQWEPPPESVYPKSQLEHLKKLRVHPQSVSEALLRRLVPKLYEIDPSQDYRVSGIAKILAEDLTNLQITLALMAQEPWDLTSLYLIGLDSLSHLGMAHRTPALAGSSSRDQELYGELVDRIYELYDEWVGSLIAAAGPDTNIVIISDHGFYHDHRRPSSLGIEATAPCAQHGPHGTIIMMGPDIEANSTIAHATLLDICPTILALCNLPPGVDMPGKVLWKKWSGTHRASWDHLLSQPPSTSIDLQPSAETTTAALQQLVALGYLPELPTNQQTAIIEASCDQLFHRALAYLEEESLEQALPLLKKAQNLMPQRTDILGELAIAHLLVTQVGTASQTIDQQVTRSAAAYLKRLVRYRRQDGIRAAQEIFQKKNESTSTATTLSFAKNWELKNLLARASVEEEGLQFTQTLAHWIAHRRTADRDRLRSLAIAHPKDPFMNFYAGHVCLAHELPEEGCRLLYTVAAWDQEEAGALSLLAEYKNRIGDLNSAEALAREALRRNPLHAASWLTLSKVMITFSKWPAAKEAARHAAQSFLRRPTAYEILATIAHHENQSDLAKRYNQLAKRAQQRLRKIFTPSEEKILGQIKPNSKPLAEPATGDEEQGAPTRRPAVYMRILEDASTGATQLFAPAVEFCKRSIVVTGLPRSGTSLLMQMLIAGGIEAVTDGERLADEFNPCGYFEHETVKNVLTDPFSFQKLLQEKHQNRSALKIVIPLLWHIPKGFDGPVIFIRRSLEEVIQSQYRMGGVVASREKLEEAYRYYESETLQIMKRRGWKYLMLSYPSVIDNPRKTALIICDFLQGSLDVKKMAAAVTPSLYRVRAKD